MRLIYEQLGRLGSATVLEGAGREGLLAVGLERVVPGARVAGPARTILCADADNLMIHVGLPLVEPGDVVIVSTPSRATDVALVGDQLVTQLHARGAAGLLVDGAIRDVDALLEIGLPVWARAITPMGPAKAALGTLDGALDLGGAIVHPADTVVLDGDGAVVVAHDRLTAVLAAAQARDDFERDRAIRYRRGELSYDIDELGDVVRRLSARSTP
jgi:4-hydroxy-4-methyl-2-oxoglutarate aldolase